MKGAFRSITIYTLAIKATSLFLIHIEAYLTIFDLVRHASIDACRQPNVRCASLRVGLGSFHHRAAFLCPNHPHIRAHRAR